MYFITQNPDDVPEDILGQLGNRVQHALRAFTARDRRALKRAAETYRPNPRFETVDAIRDVGVGEAVTSLLEDKGVPGVVERTLIRPPSSKLGPIDEPTRQQVMSTSPVAGKYETLLDRDSAYEILARRAAEAAAQAEQAERAAEEQAVADREFNAARRYSGKRVSRSTSRGASDAESGLAGSIGKALAGVVMKELKGTTGKRIVRGILGGLFKGR